MTATCRDDEPPVRQERGLDAIGGCDETIQRGVQVLGHEFRVELESERIAEGRFDHETAEIIGRAAEPPQHDRQRRSSAGA